jgi:predicted nucleotidyltransferase
MPSLLEQHFSSIQRLCRDHHVKTLHAFGSVLRPEFGPGSDIDLLVVFDRSHQPSAFAQFFEFKESLETVLGRAVDLISYDSIQNPFFKLEIEATKQAVYAA